MHTLHAALCMRIADALEAVARIGSPRLVAYGDLMFGRITILVRQYSRRQVGRGAPRAAALVRHGGGSGALDMLAVARPRPRQTPLVGTRQAKCASGTCRAYSWLAASPQRHSAQIAEGLGSPMAPSDRRLLDSQASQASVLASYIADLEQREADIRLQLDAARALQSELLGTADVLNRQRLG